MDKYVKVLTVVLLGICAVPLCGIAIQEVEETRQPILEITDKPAPIEVAEEVAEQVEEMQEEQAQEEYYEPVYYAPKSVWYESDDADAEQAAKDWISWRESGDNYEARNGQYVGKFQLQEDMLGGDYSPEHQEERADEYVADRYGSWQAAKDFWQENGWY